MTTRRLMSTKGQLKKPLVGEIRRRSHGQGNGRDLIQVFLKSRRLSLKLDSDHTWIPHWKNWLDVMHNHEIRLSDKVSICIIDFLYAYLCLYHFLNFLIFSQGKGWKVNSERKIPKALKKLAPTFKSNPSNGSPAFQPTHLPSCWNKIRGCSF